MKITSFSSFRRSFGRFVVQGTIWLALVGSLVWAAAAIYYSNLPAAWLRTGAALLFAVGLLVVLVRVRPRRLARLICFAAFFVVLGWFLLIPPSNQRDWQPDVAVLPSAEMNGQQITIHNIRNCDYRTETDYTVRHYDKAFDLTKLQSVDFFVVYWGSPLIAHTMMSFGFEGDDYICFSIETRKEKGESYSAIKGFFRQFELTYVIGDERDLVRLRTNFRGEQVYRYRLNADLAVGRLVFLDYLKEVNRLKEKPEWYNAVTANCTTLIRGHTRPYASEKRFDWRILLNGHIDEMAYERKSLDQSIPFPELKARSLINERAKGADQDAAFSKRIREQNFGAEAATRSSNIDWPAYLGDKGRNLYSPLQQINRSNVSQLKVAWTFDTGEKGEYQANNLIIAGVLYTASPTRKVIALDAATGQQLWQWDARSERPGGGGGRQRGLVFWQNETGGEQRLFSGVGNYLYALDPKSGQTIRSFGTNGSIHLGSGLDSEGTPAVGLNTPGVTYKDLLIIGGIGGPGAIRAFDVRTGQRRWIFHLIPRPGELGYDTWPAEAYKTATGLMPWSGQSLDEKRGIVFVPTKTAEPDFYGGARPGMNLFANSLVALDAATGKRLWHYQIVHHDLLDKDLPCPPVLLTVTHAGKKIDAVAQGTKHGLLFVFDRVTGAPLWPIEEKPVPPSDLRGEQAWPTQPFPTKPAPLMRQGYGEADASTVSPEAHSNTLERIRLSPNFGPFPTPSLRETVMFPGFDGGMEWGGGAADPDGIYYVNINEIPWLMQMVETRRADGTSVPRGERDYMSFCAACHGLDRKGNPAGGFPTLLEVGTRKTREQISLITKQGAGRMPAFDSLSEAQRNAILDYVLGEGSPSASRPEAGNAAPASANTTPPYAFSGFRRWQDAEGYPAIKPPWGTLNAVDLNTGEIRWKVPLGEYPKLKARGLPPTGTENYGGPVVTAGGLIFIGATADETFRAFDQRTGAILWQTTLPFGGNATPSTYMVNGRQFVVISAGGAKSGRPAGGHIIAFALPEPTPK